MPPIFPEYIDFSSLDPDSIVNILYDQFSELMVNRPVFNGQKIYIDCEKIKNLSNTSGIDFFISNSGYKIGIVGIPLKTNLEERFYHIISRDISGSHYGIDTIRTFDQDRACRINHIRPSIESHPHTEITYFRYMSRNKILHIFWARARDFVVLVREGYRGKGYYYMDTSYCVDTFGAKKLEKMYNNRIR